MIQPATAPGKCNFSTLRLFMPVYRSLLLTTVAILSACGDADSPERQVRQVIAEMTDAAEARDVGELVQHLSLEYRDAHGRTPDEVARYVRGYFIANQSIHLLTRVEDIEFPMLGEARARVMVVAFSREADAASQLVTQGKNVEAHEFKLALRREEDGEWKVHFAEWGRQ
jgi:hypothetical protein